jgi:hypothetical protein
MREMRFAGVVARLHGQSRAIVHLTSELPRSSVRVLDDEAKLSDAIERAITFERGIALRAAENISRYEQMARKGGAAEVPAVKAQTKFEYIE